MAVASRAVTITAKFLGGSSVKRGAEEVSGSIRTIGDETKKTDDKARSSGGGWAYFSKNVDEAGKKSHDTGGHIGGLVKTVAGMGLAMGGGILALSTIKSSIDGVGEKAEEVRQAQALGLGENSQQTLIMLSAYKQRGIGMQQVGQTMKQLAKSSYIAEQQEGKQAKHAAKAAESRSRQLMSYGRQMEKYQEKVSEGKKATPPLPLANPKELPELGIKAKAYEKLGIVVGNFRKLSATKQLEEVGEKLSQMPVGPERTRIATELLGRSAQKILPAFEKGEGNIKNMQKWAKEYLPEFGKGGAAGMEKFRFATMKMNMAMEGLKLRLGMAMAPIMLKSIKWFTELYKNISHGTGAWKGIEKEVSAFVRIGKDAIKILENVVKWIAKNEVALVLVTSALIAYGLIMGKLKIDAFIGSLKMMLASFGLLETEEALITVTSVVMWTAITGGVILAIAGIILLIKHWKQVKQFFVDVWNWIKTHWQLLGTIIFGPFFWAGTEVIKHWKDILKFFEGLGKGIAGVFEGLGSTIATVFKKALDYAVIDPINFALHKAHEAYKKIPFVPAWPVPDPLIPKLASGGMVRHPGFAIVGERGPEMIQLPQYARVQPLSHKASRGGIQGVGGQFEAGAGDLHLHIEMDRREVATAVLKDFRFRSGRS